MKDGSSAQQAATAPRFATNLDTDFLKLIAIVTMLIDHAGAIFFPEMDIFRVIGRLAFPLFAYCICVGCAYTHDIRRYALRLLFFGIISQPFYVFAFHSEWMLPNIMFTLLAGVLCIWCIQKNTWWSWLALVGIFVAVSLSMLDYSAELLIFILFYLLRNKPFWLGLVGCLNFGLVLFTGNKNLWLGPLHVDRQGFAVLSMIPILLHTHTGIKINKWVFYGFYPGHLLLLGLLRLALHC